MVSSAVALFVVVTQLLWQSIGDLVGKGLDAVVFLKLLFYASMTVMPLAIILGVLIASLMTFGNLAERMELLAMKAAGIPLLTIMKPLFVTVLVIAGGLFVFQNDYMITSQVRFWQYYFSIKNKSPELAIPEGVFYKDLQNFSIYVDRKDSKAKMMYGLMIYDLSDGFENATILVADSGRLYSAKDGTGLVLELFHGESFQNLKSQDTYYSSNAERPFLRERFQTKELTIPFDANLSMIDADILTSQFVGKDLFELKAYTDSLTTEIDSLAKANQQLARLRFYDRAFEGRRAPASLEQLRRHTEELEQMREQTTTTDPSAAIETSDRSALEEATALSEAIASAETSEVEEMAETTPLAAASDQTNAETTLDKEPAVTILTDLPKELQRQFDLEEKWQQIPLNERSELLDRATAKLSNEQNDLYFTVEAFSENVDLRRKNEFEYWRKFTYPVACISFFLIGAPLGAVIRKGGLGVPFITAVFFFIIFYILESFGWKMVREGTLHNWFGMWLPNIALIPMGIGLCYLATKDSARVSLDGLFAGVKRFFSTSTDREIEYKEVAMVNVNYHDALEKISLLDRQIEAYQGKRHLSYFAFFLNQEAYERELEINRTLEQLVAEMSNSRHVTLLHQLGLYPYLGNLSRTLRPRAKWLRMAILVGLPIGLPIYVIHRMRNKVYREKLGEVLKVNKEMRSRIAEVMPIPR